MNVINATGKPHINPPTESAFSIELSEPTASRPMPIIGDCRNPEIIRDHTSDLLSLLSTNRDCKNDRLSGSSIDNAPVVSKHMARIIMIGKIFRSTTK